MTAFPPKEDLFSPQRLRDNWNAAAAREKTADTTGAVQTGAGQTGAVQTEAVQTEAAQTGAVQTEVSSSEAAPSEPQSSQASPSQASPSQASPSQASPSQASPSQAPRAPEPTAVLISELCQRIDESVVGADNRFMQHAMDCLRQASELPPGEELALALDMVEDLLDESVIRSP